MRTLFFILLLACAYPCTAESTLDSLSSAMEKMPADTNKVAALNDLSDQLEGMGDFQRSLQYANDALALSQKLRYKAGIANSYFNIGYALKDQGDYSAALKNFHLSLKLREEMNDRAGIARTYNGIGNVYDIKGNYPEALKNYFETLKINEALDNKQRIASTYNNIGIVYWEQHNYEEALKSHESALKIRKELNDLPGMCASYNNIAIVYLDKKDYEKALSNSQEALKLARESGDKKGIADIYSNIGNIYTLQKDYPEALQNQLSALQLRQEIDYKLGIASSYINVGDVYARLRDKAAADYLNKALVLSKELGAKQIIRDAYLSLLQFDSIKGDWENAFINHKLFISYRDSLYNEEYTKKTVQARMEFEFEKKQIAEEAEKKRQEEIAEAEHKRTEYLQLMGIGVFIMLLISVLMLLSRRKVKTKVIDIMSTFFVLIVFELLAILLHPRIEELVHHNLIFTLVCMVCLASIIVPLHHRAEHWLKNKIGQKVVLITNDGTSVTVNEEVIEEINTAKEEAEEAKEEMTRNEK